ncbi:hypothetical protein DFQ01_11230 [Paenibacillus cellulosilyticus]|uniref:PH (Pleckstrin Homology) domain-containing protein n=1 Tax=Paenibacillus cellulosilyticus TaxID=375489 RepID=A0A2V2YRK1_9BACL|nr:hypothetical protein [Paenibacillus cellulosilyticus]PWW00677.1 hypothetical protein DFQ01_11230 [Paenibacillus cellulosilyticus]QKS45538.1 hypothetical protein HUB94_14715 [Paenibacillus cellulosilyticus]
MSRSWERKVRNNMNKLNKQRKKQGIQAVVPAGDRSDTFKGRSYIGPILLILITAMYALFVQADKSQATMYWVTIGCYLFLALLFVLRRPYIKVGTDYVQTRKFSGDRKLKPEDIKSITAQEGYVVIERVRGSNWVFSRIMNRYPTIEISERLKQFAKQHNVQFNEK